jgi:hypothetical protein
MSLLGVRVLSVFYCNSCLQVSHNSAGSLHDRTKGLASMTYPWHMCSTSCLMHTALLDLFSICQQCLEFIVKGNCPNPCERIQHHRNEHIIYSVTPCSVAPQASPLTVYSHNYRNMTALFNAWQGTQINPFWVLMTSGLPTPSSCNSCQIRA